MDEDTEQAAWAQLALEAEEYQAMLQADPAWHVWLINLDWRQTKEANNEIQG